MRQPTAREQDCLKAIHRLGGEEKAVATQAIADLLGVRSATTSVMLDRLVEAGLVEKQRYSGSRLTPAGVTEARAVIRRHRLIGLFLTRVLGFDSDEVDVEAEALEHAVSDLVEQAISRFLGNPQEDL